MSLSTLPRPMEQRIRRMNDAITPFTLAVPQADLEDLNRRIDQTRWPDAETVDDWTQSAPLAKVKALVDHWASPLRLAPLRGDAERLGPVQDRHRRPRHPFPACPLEARERAAADHHPRLAGLANPLMSARKRSAPVR